MIIAQISDPHINSTPNANEARLQQAVAHLLRLPARPDVVLITGDCTHNGAAAEYERFRELLSPLPMPYYVIPGNHDDRQQMLAIFGEQGSKPLAGFVQYVVEGGPVRLVALDTSIPGRNEGALSAEQLGWLSERLAEAPEQPTLLFMHHPPFRSGMAVMDGIGLADADALGAIVAANPQVELIVAGHVHNTTARRFYGTLAVTCTSVNHQMLPDFSRPELLSVVMEPPACLLHVWNSAGLVTYPSPIGDHGPTVLVHDGERWLA